LDAWTEYRARKQREIRLLRDAPLALWPAAWPDLEGLAGEKRGVFRAHPAFRAAAAFPETNWADSETRSLGTHEIQYNYQRFDLQVSAPPVYPALGPEELTFYTCSGMAAIAAVISALDRLAQTRIDFWSLSDSYFETQHLVRHYAPHLDVRVAPSFEVLRELPSEAFRVLHVDSISASAPDERWGSIAPRTILALFDTTCYSRGDARIADTVRRFDALGIPVAVVRSHLKLDSLGMEAGRLGSILLRASPRCGELQRQAAAGLARLVPDVVRLFGTAPFIDRFFVVADESELLALSELRADRIQSNSAALADELERALPPTMQVRRYHHGMFTTHHHPDWTDAAPVKAMAARIARRCRSVGCHVAQATSFGFDFTVITDVMDVPTQRFALRLAPSDEPLEALLPLVGAMAEELR
jgi:hypothetical protein